MSLASTHREERIRRVRDTFIMLVWAAMRQFSQELQCFGLTLPQFVALAALVAHREPCTMRHLTEVTLQDPPTMTGIVDRLVKMSLVKRTRVETDRRLVLVQATPAGTDLLTRIRNEALEATMTDYVTLTNVEEAKADRWLEYFEQALEFVLRAQLKRRDLADADLDAQIEKIRLFLTEPVG